MWDCEIILRSVGFLHLKLVFAVIPVTLTDSVHLSCRIVLDISCISAICNQRRRESRCLNVVKGGLNGTLICFGVL